MKYLLFLIEFLIVFTSCHKFKCVFDQLYKDYRPQDNRAQPMDQPLLENTNARRLQVLVRKPMRITLDTSYFNTIQPGSNGAASTTLAHLQFIKRAMQVSTSFYMARLKVTPMTAQIKSPVTCFDSDWSTPLNDRSNGIASSDLHIYVRYITKSTQGYGATGISCLQFSDTSPPDSTFRAGRSIVGRIIFDTYTLLQVYGISDQALLTNIKFSRIAATAIHETMHILGFNSDLYETYLDPTNALGDVYQTPVISGPTLLHPSRPEPSYLMTTPSVKAWARSFFNCPTLTGMQLQNEDKVQPGSHWERTVMYDDLMTGTQLGSRKSISSLTFALLKDMGWYDVDDTFNDTTNYGHQKGCSFFTDACYQTNPSNKYFCDKTAQTGVAKCSTTFLGKSTCRQEDAIMADGCGMWVQYMNCVDPDFPDGFKQYTLEVYGTTSFCADSTFGLGSISSKSSGRCYTYVCSYLPSIQSVIFTIGSNTVTCLKSENGTTKKLGSLAGQLNCPNYNDFCVNSRKICKNWCSKNGICMGGICNCYQNYAGEDCSISTCVAGQYYNPVSKTCGSACLSGYYQNLYSKTCMPCDPKCPQCAVEPTLCTACHFNATNPQVKYGTQCLSACPNKTYQSGDICLDCSSASPNFCLNCITSAASCTSCQPNLYLSNPTMGTCGATCPSATYRQQDRVNFKCVNTCSDNLISTTESGTGIGICIMCGPGLFKRLDSTCHSSCLPKYYPNIPERFCKQCHITCLYCDGQYAQNCTDCNSARPQKYWLLKMCVTSCPSGYYANDTSLKCEMCTSQLNCASCYVANISLAVKCYTCIYGFYYQANRTCTIGCDIYMYQNKWNHSCNACSPSCGDCTSPYNSSCTNCRANMFFLSNQTGGYCLSNCPTTLYVTTGTNCLSCHKTCFTCNGVTSSSCSSCATGLYLYGGYCRYVCPQQTYPNETTHSCSNCDSQCKFCFGSTVDNCTSCMTNLVLNNFTCTTACPTGMIANQWSVCQKFQFYLKQGLYCTVLIIALICIN